MSSCSSFWGELVKKFNKSPALRPEMKGLRPGARLSTYNVAPLVKKSNKTQLISPRNIGLQLLFTSNAAKFLLSQAIDKAEVAAPLIVKNFNKIARADLNIAALFSVQVAALFRSKSQLISQLLWSKFPLHHPSRRVVAAEWIQTQLSWNLLNILTELVKNFNLTGTPSVRKC